MAKLAESRGKKDKRTMTSDVEDSVSDTLIKSKKAKKKGKKLVKGESSKGKPTKSIEKKDKKRKRKKFEKGESSKRRGNAKQSSSESSDEELVEKSHKKSKQSKWIGILTLSSPLQLFKQSSSNEEELVEKRHKKSKQNKWFEIRTRSSPLQLYKQSSSDEEFVEKTQKKSERKKWFSIYTRSSPLQLSKCISVLKENQREAVRKMGFGQLLSFRVDGIPAKLGHYVVDRFNPEKMEIKVPCGRIKVNREAIHRLLGLPCGGIQLDSVTPLEPLDDSVGKWKNQYPGRFIAPSQLVNKIENSNDEDSFDFRLDFLMLFLTIMVECHKHGRCRVKVLEHLRGDTKFNEIDWCSYIVESMKTCKEGWTRCGPSSPFTGPLTILTLLYVESVECKGINVDGTINALTFWNKDRLKHRETLEIRGGGFGRGKLKLSQEDAQRIREKDFLDEMSKVEKQFDVMVKNKKKVEKTLCQIYQKYPKNEVLTLMARYESLLEDKPTWPPKPKEESMETDGQRNDVLTVIGDQVNTDEEKSDDECTDEEHNSGEESTDSMRSEESSAAEDEARAEDGEKPVEVGIDICNDQGERNTNEETIVVAKFITDFSRSEKSSEGGNEAGAEGGEKLVEAEPEKVVDQDKKAESTKGNESMDDKNGLENFVDIMMEQETIEGKDKADASEGCDLGVGAAERMTKMDDGDQSSCSLGLSQLGMNPGGDGNCKSIIIID